MKQVVCIFIIALPWPQLVNAQVSCAESLETCAVFMMVGDSITYGTGVDNGQRPGIGNGQNRGPSVLELQRLLDDSSRPSLGLNWGIGGSSSGGNGPSSGVERINSLISTSISRHPATQYFALIQYGTNDQNFGISTSTTKANIESMVIQSRNRGVTPVLSNLPPRSEPDQIQNILAINQKILEVAINMSVPGVDNFSSLSPANSTYFVLEGNVFLHPNQAGYDLIAKNWFEDQMQSLIEPTLPPEPELNPIIAPIIGLLMDEE